MKQFTKEQIKIIKKYKKRLDVITDDYFKSVYMLEKVMAKELKVKDAEFFMGDDGSYCGVVNARKTYGLYQF